jgi:hypothetical protein
MRVLAQQLSQEAHGRRTQAEAALRNLGTNALPTLLKKLQARDSALAQKLASLIARLGMDPYEHVLHEARDHKQALQGFAPLADCQAAA